MGRDSHAPVPGGSAPTEAPPSRTARLTKNTAEGFDTGGRRQLRDVALVLAERGYHVVVSNSTAPEIVELYEGC